MKINLAEVQYKLKSKINPNVFLVKHSNNQVSLGIGSDASLSDIATIKEWYNYSQKNQKLAAHYPEKYKNWWIEHIESQSEDKLIRKLEIEDKVVSFVSLENIRKERLSNQPRTFITGVTGAPLGDKTIKNKNLLALLDACFRAKEAFQNEILAGNAVPEMKRFYSSFYCQPIRKSLDGIRDYYEISINTMIEKISQLLK